jgi:5,10-methylene-tetrahydrofolate dehydrogenase/methenyl tetrahydrofolate cyclohydrolase
MNKNSYIYGILMFRPLPGRLGEAAACRAIDPSIAPAVEAAMKIR